LKLFNRLPEFDFVAFRVENPAEFAILGVFFFVENVNAFPAQSFKQRVQIFHAKIEHKFLCGRIEILRVLLKERKCRPAFFPFLKLKIRISFAAEINAEMFFIPRGKCFGFSALKNMPPMPITLFIFLSESEPPAVAGGLNATDSQQ